MAVKSKRRRDSVNTNKDDKLSHSEPFFRPDDIWMDFSKTYMPELSAKRSRRKKLEPNVFKRLATKILRILKDKHPRKTVRVHILKKVFGLDTRIRRWPLYDVLNILQGMKIVNRQGRRGLPTTMYRAQRLYAALHNSPGVYSVKTISSALNIPTQRTYHIVIVLSLMGLVKYVSPDLSDGIVGCFEVISNPSSGDGRFWKTILDGLWSEQYTSENPNVCSIKTNACVRQEPSVRSVPIAEKPTLETADVHSPKHETGLCVEPSKLEVEGADETQFVTTREKSSSPRCFLWCEETLDDLNDGELHGAEAPTFELIEQPQDPSDEWSSDSGVLKTEFDVLLGDINELCADLMETCPLVPTLSITDVLLDELMGITVSSEPSSLGDLQSHFDTEDLECFLINEMYDV